MARCAYATAIGHKDLIEKVNNAFFPKNNSTSDTQTFDARFSLWLSIYKTQEEWNEICLKIEHNSGNNIDANPPSKQMHS